jgi:hypothetical protein
MSSPASPAPKLGPFQDDFGDLSLGRIIVFMATVLGILMALAGTGLSIWEAIRQVAPKTNYGFALAGVGLGAIWGAFALKGWQRQSEAKIAGGTP